MIKSICKVQIEGENFEIVSNVSTMMEAENISGKPFMDLVKSAETGSISAIATLLSVCLRKDKEQVGTDFVGEMDFGVFQELFEPLIDTIISSFPSKDTKKKVKVITKIIK